MKCPKCKEEIQVEATAIIPETQKLNMAITLKEGGGYIGAETLGKSITNMSIALKASAKSINQKVEVFVENCTFNKNKISVEFFIARVSEPLKKVK